MPQSKIAILIWHKEDWQVPKNADDQHSNGFLIIAFISTLRAFVLNYIAML